MDRKEAEKELAALEDINARIGRINMEISRCVDRKRELEAEINDERKGGA